MPISWQHLLLESSRAASHDRIGQVSGDAPKGWPSTRKNGPYQKITNLFHCYPVAVKTLEKIVSDRISFPEYQNLLSMWQIGFRSDRSASDDDDYRVGQALDNGTDIYVIALDTESAFDCVWRRGLAAKLKSSDISEPLFTFLTDCLKGRSVYVVLKLIPQVNIQ